MSKYYYYNNFKKIIENQFTHDQLINRTNYNIFNFIKKTVTEEKKMDDKKLYNHILDYIKNQKDIKTTNKKTRNVINYKTVINLSKFINNINEWSKIKFKNDKKILDIGSGSGEKTILIRKFLKFDLKNTFCLEMESKKNNMKVEDACNFSYYEGKKIPFEDNTFDVITIFLVIHYVKDLNKFIKEVKRVINKDGIIIIREHNIESKEDELNIKLLQFIYNLMDKVEYKDIDKTKFYSSKQLIEKLEKNKFEFVKYSYTSGFTKARYIVMKNKN